MPHANEYLCTLRYDIHTVCVYIYKGIYKFMSSEPCVAPPVRLKGHAWHPYNRTNKQKKGKREKRITGKK